MGYVRVKPWERGSVVAHPETGQFIAPDPSALYRDDEPLVQAHSWLFATDDEIAAAADSGVEQATAAPGERRTTRRSKPKE